ncbi:tetratricopeptide repeat protein [Tateyamaria sp. SN6-1]|uniref:tetratricopeptide repeat protein n=1 Tax=Tateyamaria sp. SN6-1 TaxID=3092148 RepID=UPI0039F525C7
MTPLLLVLPLLLLFGGGVQANETRIRFEAIRASEHVDAGAATQAMVALAEQGFAPAMDRVGYYHRHGVGTPKDLLWAHRWYVRAVASGHPWSTASLARVEIELGLEQAAHHRLKIAIRDGKPGVHRLFATAHIDGKFGRSSDPDTGRAVLERLSADGDVEAARDLMQRINWRRLNNPAPAPVVDLVVQAGLRWDPRFAEPALIYLSRYGGREHDAMTLRSRLIDVPGIRHRVVAPERIRLAAVRSPQRFWSQAEIILGDSSGEGFVRAAITAFWINKNAWVRVLQSELRQSGYYSGQINGRMTKRTIRAQNRFCRDAQIWTVCSKGPLTGATVRAVAQAIQTGKSNK